MYVVYRAPATGTLIWGSCTGSHYDWLAWHGTGLQLAGDGDLQAAAKCQLKMASTFKHSSD